MKIRSARIGTKEQFEEKRINTFKNFVRIDDAEIYINSEGDILLIASKVWVDTLTQPNHGTTILER